MPIIIEQWELPHQPTPIIFRHDHVHAMINGFGFFKGGIFYCAGNTI